MTEKQRDDSIHDERNGGVAYATAPFTKYEFYFLTGTISIQYSSGSLIK